MTGKTTHLPIVVRNEIDKKRMLIAIAVAAAALVCSLSLLITQARQPKPPVVISVSIKSLLEEHMVTTIGQSISQGEAELRTSEYVASIEGAIADLTGDDSVIVIASEAVLGNNVPDFTGDVRLMARERAEALAARRGSTLPPMGDQSSVNAMLDRMAADTAALQDELTRLENHQTLAQREVQ